MAHADPFVFTKKTAFMQRLADLVRSGHCRYVSGTIPLGKVGHLATKFDRLYQPNLPRLQAHRRRAKGEATARLLFWYDENKPEQLTWILMATAGQLVAGDNLEKWADPTNPKSRIHLTGYELVRITKAEEPKPVWTWRYDKQRLADLRNEIVGAIRLKHDHQLESLIATLWRSPGFSGIRDQVKGCGQLIRSEWKRCRSKADPMPDIPTRLGYVQRLADKGVKLSQIKSSQGLSVPAAKSD